MADDRDPLRQLIDVAVYAPVGLLVLVRNELPNLIETGRTRVDNQITLARFIGKMALTRGRQELQRRLDAAEAARSQGPVVDANSRPVDTDAGSPAVVDLSVGVDQDLEADFDADFDADFGPDEDELVPTGPSTLPEAIITAVAAPAEIAREPVDPTLPIDGYDSLAASQVVVRLGSLTDDELEVIRDHEASHRARRTILGKISQLQAR